MNPPVHEPTPSWEELRPLLDELMHRLSPMDREAVLLRFFQNRPLAPGVYGQVLDPADRQRLREFRQRQRREVVSLLGDAAAEAEELRSSPEADDVRQVMPAARDEEEFQRRVAAARAVDVDSADASADSIRQHLPASSRDASPSVRDLVMERFREGTDPGRIAEIERDHSEAQRRGEEQHQARRERARLDDLAAMAREGGVELSEDEVRVLATAIERRGAELEQEWGEPPSNPTPEQRATWEGRLRDELERIAVATVGDRGRAIVEQMARRRNDDGP